MESSISKESNFKIKENSKLSNTYENYFDTSLNEIAINTPVNNVKELKPKANKTKEYNKYFDNFYYSMFLSNKD